MQEVRIEDLRTPQRSPAGAVALRLRAVDASRARSGCHRGRGYAPRSGLQDFGDDSLLDRLAAQVAAMEADTGLTGLGRHLVRERLVGLLGARLRFEDYVRRHPEALEVELEPPVIVVGLPRSGTTHLVNLLAADSRFRSMPWWEVIEPIAGHR